MLLSYFSKDFDYKYFKNNIFKFNRVSQLSHNNKETSHDTKANPMWIHPRKTLTQACLTYLDRPKLIQCLTFES